MRVLIIGGTGLISTPMVDQLIAKGHEPILFNRGQTKKRYTADVKTITGDRTDFVSFKELMTKVKCDVVIDMITFNAETAKNAIEVFGGRVKHYIFCSTVCVYGDLTRVPADESEPHTPTGEYGKNKSLAEQAFLEAYKKSGFPITIMRPSHSYGPGLPLLDIWGFNPHLISRIRAGRPSVIAGDGTTLWQPCYVGDVAKGFVGAVGQSGMLGKAYNVVGDEFMEWRDFQERLARAIGCEPNLVTLTTEQILAGSPAEHNWLHKEIFQFNAIFSNARLKKAVPEFTELLSWEEGVRLNVAWMDENDIHKPWEEQPWIDELAAHATRFKHELEAGQK